jgi:hypothetical protein
LAHDQAKATWLERRLPKEESGSSGDINDEEASKVILARGEDNPGLGDGNLGSGNCNPKSGNFHPEPGNRNPDSGNSNPHKEDGRQREEPILMDINMAFTILVEFRAPTNDVAELALGAECAMLEELENPGELMKPLFIWGHLVTRLIGHMLVMEVQASTSYHCRCSRSSATSEVILNIQILPLSVLQVIQRRQKE